MALTGGAFEGDGPGRPGNSFLTPLSAELLDRNESISRVEVANTG
jgi:hypothetical protein